MPLPTSHIPSRLLAAGALTLSLALGAMIVPATAAARGGDAIRVTGSCSGHSTSKLKAKHDDGRIEVEFEVDQNRNRQQWRVKLWDDGIRVFSGYRWTAPPSGSFSLERRIANRAGTDTIKAKAVNVKSGEICRATLNV
jgi:hypothetical protein